MWQGHEKCFLKKTNHSKVLYLVLGGYANVSVFCVFVCAPFPYRIGTLFDNLLTTIEKHQL